MYNDNNSTKKSFGCARISSFITEPVTKYFAKIKYGSIDDSIGDVSIIHGTSNQLTPKARLFVEDKVKLCKPKDVFICDGSEEEANRLVQMMEQQGILVPLPKYNNCWLARTNPLDVARVESKTFLCTREKREAVPFVKNGSSGSLGNWISPQKMDEAIYERFPGCMKGRTMYVIPFSMGPVGSRLSKIGIQLTDSPYVVISMRIMTRMGVQVLEKLNEDRRMEFVKALHSVGKPYNEKNIDSKWPCDPERTIILHKMEENEIVSYGSGYGGNSLLGKKCFALRIGSYIAKKEGWFAEHMLILGITNPEGRKRYIAAAFPSACGKTNLAMMKPTLPGYKIECVGDDIAWMRFDKNGQLRAINPENGFFGVAPGTSKKTNPIAMDTIFKDTIFTNVASTSDGGVHWEGLDLNNSNNIKVTDWLGKPWNPNSKTPSAHPNSRFCTPAKNCPIIDNAWEDPNGVVIDAILFGGRRPEGVPLVYESLNWNHGVFIGASMKSETTAAAEHKSNVIMHDPFAMRPFFGYNFGKYLDHWLSMSDKQYLHLPKIFHVNWFRKDKNGKFLWPGFGENSRVIDWIFRRVENENIAVETAIGYVPREENFRLDGLSDIDFQQLFNVDQKFWKEEINEVKKYFHENVGEDLPPEITNQANILKFRLS